MTKNMLSALPALVHSPFRYSVPTSVPMTGHFFGVLEKPTRLVFSRLETSAIMVKLSTIVLMMGLILSFHDTLWGWAGLFALGWALLAAVEYRIKLVREGRQ